MNLTKVQLQSEIDGYLSKENGLNELLTMTLNGLMYCERHHFLSQRALKNKGNGYRPFRGLGFGKSLQVSIPRDWLGVFQPVILALSEDQEVQLQELSFELYGKGFTTAQIGPILERIYGHRYSKSSISRISEHFQMQMQQ